MGRSWMALVSCCMPLLLLTQTGCERGAVEEAPLQSGVSALAPAEGDTTRMYMVRMDGLRRPDLIGSAGFVPRGDQSLVMVGVRGATAGGTLRGNIHRADTCDDNPGEPVFPLEAITVGADGTGKVRTTLPATTPAVFDGNHLIVYQEEGGGSGSVVICGDIPIMVQ